MAPKVCFLGAVRRRTRICCRNVNISASSAARDPLEAIANDYLSPEHRKDRAHGCPLAALGSELARSEKSTRSAATEGILKMIATVAERMKDPNTDRAKKSASVFVATMLGALTISRIVADPKVSNEILAAARAKLSSWE